MDYVFSERDLGRQFTGMVAAGMAVRPGLDRPSAACARCGCDLDAGDRVTVSLTYYDNHTWEPFGLYCSDHSIETVAEDVGVEGVDQAVVEAALERAGYRSPTGTVHPDALTLGAVEVLDYSPAAEGYRSP